MSRSLLPTAETAPALGLALWAAAGALLWAIEKARSADPSARRPAPVVWEGVWLCAPAAVLAGAWLTLAWMTAAGWGAETRLWLDEALGRGEAAFASGIAWLILPLTGGRVLWAILAGAARRRVESLASEEARAARQRRLDSAAALGIWEMGLLALLAESAGPWAIAFFPAGLLAPLALERLRGQSLPAGPGRPFALESSPLLDEINRVADAAGIERPTILIQPCRWPGGRAPSPEDIAGRLLSWWNRPGAGLTLPLEIARAIETDALTAMLAIRWVIDLPLPGGSDWKKVLTTWKRADPRARRSDADFFRALAQWHRAVAPDLDANALGDRLLRLSGWSAAPGSLRACYGDDFVKLVDEVGRERVAEAMREALRCERAPAQSV
jgi:hypothetical protein